MAEFKVYIDGASRGNPGESGVGVVVCDASGKIIKEFSKYIGIATNNQAEYCALISALDVTNDFKDDILTFYVDSEVLYKHLTGEYRIRDKNLKMFFDRAMKSLKGFKKVNFEWIPREKNKIADKLSQKAINLKT